MYKHIHGDKMFETKEENLAYIKKHHSQDMMWHKQDLEKNVSKKSYDFQYKLILIDHLSKFKAYSELSAVTGVDIKILKQWIYMANLKRCHIKNAELQLLKVCFKNALHHRT